AMRRLRDALNDSAEEPRYIETLPRHGYRFIAQVTLLPTPREPTPAKKDQPTTIPPTSRLNLRALLFPSLAVTALLLVLLLGLAARNLFVSNAASQVRSIAVLPLANLSGNPDREYFADGMTDALITDLAHIRSLRVISRNSTIRYKGTKKS